MILFIYELKKVFSQKNILMLILAFIVQVVFVLLPKNYTHDYSPEIYQKYMSKLEGEYTSEKRQYIDTRYSEIEQLLSTHEEMITAYKCSKITLSEFEQHNYAYQIAFSEQATVAYCIQKCNYYDSLETSQNLFYDTEWNDLFSHSNYNFILIFVMLFLIAPIFAQEHSSHSCAMLLHTLKGRSIICRIKLITAGCAAFSIALIFYGIRILPLIGQGWCYAENPVSSIMGFSAYSNLNLWQLFVLDTLFKAIIWAIGALFICVMSNLLRNIASTFFMSFVFLSIPALLPQELSGNGARFFFCAVQLDGLLPVWRVIGIMLAVGAAKIYVYSLLTLNLWKKPIDF